MRRPPPEGKDQHTARDEAALSWRAERIRAELTPAVENLVLLSSTGSTQALARALIDAMDGEEQPLAATVFISERQDRGEGRAGRQWASPVGGLYLSWLRSGLDSRTIALLPMLAAAAAQTAVAEVGVAGVGIKWPNDLLVDGRKLAGIVVFARHGDPSWAAVGLGINVAAAPSLDGAPGLPATAVSDHVALDDPESTRDRLACSFVNHLSTLVAAPEQGLEVWRELLLQRPGDTVSIRLASGEQLVGAVVAIEAEGFLRLRCGGEERIVTSGDIVES